MEFFKKPRRVYYLKKTGAFILDTGEYEGTYNTNTTVEEDFEIYAVLKTYTRDAIGYFQFEFGQYSKEFSNVLPFVIDPVNETIVFDYTRLKKNIEDKIAEKQQEIVSLETELNQLDQH